MVNVPSGYQSLVSQMSSATGIPQDVIAAQANTESGFSATARSSAGAEGWLQFLPSTYDSYASQAGVAPGTEFNPADEAKVYDVYMSSLVQQEKGNLRNALAAYNAGPGNLQAGYSYADKILGEAGQSGNITTTGSLGSTIGGALGGLTGGLSISGILGSLTTDLRDIFERLGLILLGAALILLGIHILANGSKSQPINIETPEAEGGRKQEGTTKHSSKPAATGGSTVAKTGAEEAVEAAAVA